MARSLNTKAAHRLTEAAVDPRELLWGILTTLSRIRGSQSYLFPSLLERCKGAMDFTSPTSMGNFLPPLSTAPTWEEETGLAVVTVPENPDSHEPETALMEPLSQLLPTPQVQFPENNLLN